ncbi:hypothetical protein HPP92_023037 [Vanilla planifolia]|uniref:Uncharacterized protein n=1 Tax=Vanilla planifolia TaxID=51239 RepID=A0A835PPM6_VANPL|nr:hypothetical protein HPP92_023037 [Vanilla planifolia]
MASQQPPAGRWFRLASLARMEGANAPVAPQIPTTAPAPRIPISRPQQQPLPPPPPPPEPKTEFPPQLQTPGIQELTSAPPPAAEPPPRQPSTPVPRTATPPESPKVIVPSYSTRAPSPMAEKQLDAAETPILQALNPEPEPEPKAPPPPPQPKTITVPEESKSNNGNGSKVNQKVQGSISDSSNGKATTWKLEEGKELRILTMAGENAGAIMELGSAARVGQRYAGKRLQGFGNGQGQIVEDIGKKRDEKDNGIGLEVKTKPYTAMVNSNVQSINNSIVLNSTCSQHSPGVHITFASHRQAKGGVSSPSHKVHPPLKHD